MVSRELETGADKLVELVNERKSIELKQAAKLLNTSPAVIEDWAESMSEAGLIQIDYGLGTVTLKAMPESLRQKDEWAGDQKDLEKKAAEIQKKAVQVKKKVEYTAHDIEKLEKRLDRRGKDAEKMLQDLRKTFTEGERFLHEMERAKGGAEKREKILRTKFGSLEKSLHASEKKLAELLKEFEASDKIVEEAFNSAHADDAEIRAVEEMMTHVERDRQSLEKQVGQMKNRKTLKPGVLDKLKASLFNTRAKAEGVHEKKRAVARKHEELKRKTLLAHKAVKRMQERHEGAK